MEARTANGQTFGNAIAPDPGNSDIGDVEISNTTWPTKGRDTAPG